MANDRDLDYEQMNRRMGRKQALDEMIALIKKAHITCCGYADLIDRDDLLDKIERMKEGGNCGQA